MTARQMRALVPATTTDLHDDLIWPPEASPARQLEDRRCVAWSSRPSTCRPLPIPMCGVGLVAVDRPVQLRDVAAVHTPTTPIPGPRRAGHRDLSRYGPQEMSGLLTA